MPYRITVSSSPLLPPVSAWSDELASRLAAQRSALQQRAGQYRAGLQKLHNQLAAQLSSAQPVSSPDMAGELANLQGKYDMAMADLRELRKRNADLEARGAHRAEQPVSDAMDWESQKRRMLASLEAEERATTLTPDRVDDRLTIDGTIRITDQMIADKDAEIAELKRLLEAQSQHVGQFALGAAAIGEILDTDEIIQQERQRLKQLEAELQQKLRVTEIEISKERAKLARDRVELDEIRRQLELEKAKSAPREDASTPAHAKKSTGGNWLSRLGLKGDGEGK